MIYLDRLIDDSHVDVDVTFVSAGVNSTTTWEIPYWVAVDGSMGDLAVVIKSTGEVLTTTRPSIDEVRFTGSTDYSATPVWIGILYPEEPIIRLSTIFLRNPEGKPVTRGRLKLGSLAVRYENTRHLLVRVTAGGVSRDYEVDEGEEADGVLIVPVHTQSEGTVIEIFSETPYAVNIESIDWNGEYHAKGRVFSR